MCSIRTNRLCVKCTLKLLGNQNPQDRFVLQKISFMRTFFKEMAKCQTIYANLLKSYTSHDRHKLYFKIL